MGMSTSKNWGFDIADIVATDHVTGGRPRVSDDERPIVISTLEAAALDSETKWALLRDVKRLCGDRFRHTQPRGSAWIERVMAEGLGVLDNEELALLLLNPVTLGRIEDELKLGIAGCEAWWKAMERVGAKLIENHGIEIPPLPGTEVKPESSVSPPPLFAAVLQQGETAQRAQSRSTRIEVQPKDCIWQVGRPEIGSEPAIIDIEPLPGGGFTIGLGGFLKPGPDVSARMTWNAPDGKVVASKEAANPFLLRVTLESDGRTLLANDRLEIHYQSSQEPEKQFDVRIEVVIA